MSYTPTTWTSGDIVTSAKLNKIENGIVEASSSGGCEVIQGTYTNNYNSESGSGGGTIKSLKSTSSTSSVLDYSEYIMSGTVVLLTANMSNGSYNTSMCGLILSARALISKNIYEFKVDFNANSNIISNVDSDFNIPSSDNIVFIFNLGSTPSEQEEPAE